MTLKLPSLWPVLVLAVGLLGLQCYKSATGREAVLKAQVKARERTIAALAQQARRTDSVYLRDTVTLTRWRTRYDSLVKVLPETLFIPVPVQEVLHTADSTIRACSLALQTCEQRVADRDARITALDSLVRDLKRPKPFFTRITKPILPFLVGVGAGIVLTR